VTPYRHLPRARFSRIAALGTVLRAICLYRRAMPKYCFGDARYGFEALMAAIFLIRARFVSILMLRAIFITVSCR
jgi:hypothetical protein